MTLQQYEENTFIIQSFFITNSEASALFLQLKTTSFYFPFNFETEELKNFYISLQSTSNLNLEIANEIATRLGLTYIPEKEMRREGEVCFAHSSEVRPEFRLTFAATDIFDFIYAVLHSPIYRDKYKEFLKLDSPRVAYPTDTTVFWQLVKLGGELKQTHLSALMETERIMKEINKVEIE